MTQYSASQIQTYVNCKRLWHFIYVQGIRGPTTPAQQLGKDVHKKLEDYLRGDVPHIQADDRAGEIAIAGLPHLPPPRSGHVERKIEYALNGDAKLIGYIDWLSEDPLIVMDHKTTSDKRYIKTPADLKSNIQAILYATVALRNTESVGRVNCRWLYFTTRGKSKASPVDFGFDQGELFELFCEHVLDNVEQIEKEKKKKLKLLQTEPNVDHCHAYGGCAFRSECTDLKRKSVFFD